MDEVIEGAFANCSACQMPLHRNEAYDTIGWHVRHRNRSDCLRPLRERIRTLEAGIEREAVFWAKARYWDGRAVAAAFGDDYERPGFGKAHAARLRAMFK